MPGRHHASAVIPDQDTTFEDGRLFRLALLLVAGYLFIGFMPLMRWSAVNHNWRPLIAHVVALSLCVGFALGTLPRMLRPVRDWLGIALIAFMYFDLRYIVGGIGMRRKDDVIVSLDRTFFHGDLWATLAQ